MILPKIVKSYNQNNQVMRCYDDLDEYGTLTTMYVFQSYKTRIAVISNKGIMFNSNIDAYTKTTCKYLYEFMRDFKAQSDEHIADVINQMLDDKNTKQAIIKYMIEVGAKFID